MKFIAAIAFLVFAGLAGFAQATEGCPPWPRAEKNLKLHGYTIVKLSASGVSRAASYLGARTSNPNAVKLAPSLTGYYASTRFWQAVSNGQSSGGIPSNRAVIVLTNSRGECLGNMGGTIEQITAILDGTAERLNDSFAR